MRLRSTIPFGLAAAVLVAACSTTGDTNGSDAGGDAGETASSEVGNAATETDSAAPGAAANTPAGGIRLVGVDEASSVHANRPDDLIVLDVRTPAEFAEGHLDGAIMIDFYEPDFADRLAELDPNGSYLLYCRSGNRSGQTAALMTELGFTDVADVDGGIIAWNDAGLPLVTP